MKLFTLRLLCLLLLVQITTGSGAGNALSVGEAAPLPSLQTPDHGGQIESRYDGFNYETIVTLRKMRITCGNPKGVPNTLKDTCVNIEASLHCPGIQLDHVGYARLQLVFEAKDWDRRHPLGQRDLVAVADEESLKLGTMRLVKQDVSTVRLVEVMNEVLEVSMPYETFNKLARAQVVEMKVGNTLFELGEKNLSALRDLNNRVKP
jgi:hypothetical protein